MNFSTQAFLGLGYIILLCLYAARPDWFHKWVAAARRRAREWRGTLSL